uniref:Prospero domain-containing protein n=1 Tax=Neogobius melanostomus TaxID=47308 RepID=A0A8C6S7F8_9GOBI
MIPNTWSKGLYFSNLCLTAEQPPSFHHGPIAEVPDIYFNRSEAGSHVMHYPLRGLGREAKRARVENIIKGMSGSPDVADANHQGSTGKTISLYPNQMGMFELHQLQNHNQFCQQDDVNIQDGNSPNGKETQWGASLSRNSYMYHEVKPINYTQLKDEKVKLMKEVLKSELSKALSTSVDSIFKMKAEHETSEPPLHHHLRSDSHSFSEMSALPIPATQTEALSLVVRNDKPHPASQSKHCLNHELKYHQKSLKSQRERGFEKAQLEVTDMSWHPLKVRSKVDSRSERRLFTVGHAMVKNLPLSRVKQSPGEPSSLNSIYTINEGLTTNHLKKAKLMFFYTRYPSSFVLKMCFSDVQFTRCITSQLIKWFSNFREFFYIQMEKFARHAVLRGVSGDAALTVGRESELFRVLNLHYNKTSDFQVKADYKTYTASSEIFTLLH